jgi:hypothetical protein
VTLPSLLDGSVNKGHNLFCCSLCGTADGTEIEN